MGDQVSRQLKVVQQDPRVLVSLSRVSEVVNEFFDLHDDDVIAYDTPFVWWDRSKRNIGIELPMPEPMSYVGNNKRGPLWYQEQIIQWFGAWRELEVVECVEAGDRISSRGHRIYSEYRVR